MCVSWTKEPVVLLLYLVYINCVLRIFEMFEVMLDSVYFYTIYFELIINGIKIEK